MMTPLPDPEFSDFHLFYDDVKTRLEAYVSEAAAQKEITSDEAVWFSDLIKAFEDAYNDWPTHKTPAISKYLACFRKGFQSRLFRVAGHAFLHIAYDLPRVIAKSLVLNPSLDRQSLRRIFLRPSPVFGDVFLRRARQGKLGLFPRALGVPKIGAILGYWALTLRSVAWIHAEVLADLEISPRGTTRAALEVALAKGIVAAGEKASSPLAVWNVTPLNNADLFPTGDHFPALVLPVVTAVGAARVVGVALATYFAAKAAASLHDSFTGNRIALLGQQVHLHATLAFRTLTEG
jgi:hypothetical protein